MATEAEILAAARSLAAASLEHRRADEQVTAAKRELARAEAAMIEAGAAVSRARTALHELLATGVQPAPMVGAAPKPVPPSPPVPRKSR